MATFRGWGLAVLVLALGQLPERAFAQRIGPRVSDGELTDVTADGLFLVHRDDRCLSLCTISESLVDGRTERYQLEVQHAFGDGVPEEARAREAFERQEEREQAPKVARDQKRWRAFLAHHPLAHLRAAGSDSGNGWRVRLSAPGCGLEKVFEAHDAPVRVDRCPAAGDVRLELVRGKEVHPWFTWDLHDAQELDVRLQWSDDGQWVQVDGSAWSWFLAAVPTVQLLAQEPGPRAAAAQRLEQAGYRVAASGKARDPHAASELYYLKPWEAEARRIAALLGVAPERVQPLTWEAPAPVVVVLAPGPAPSPASP